MAEMSDGITKNHRKCWLLIQLAPVTLLQKPNIFLAITWLAGGASEEYLTVAIQHEAQITKQLLPQPPTLFCMLDGVQVLTKASDHFQSAANSVIPQPILHPIVCEWSSILPDLIVSGTGISMQEVKTVISSAVAREGDAGCPETVTEIGGFDDEGGQQAYLKQYFPPGILTQEIVSQVGY